MTSNHEDAFDTATRIAAGDDKTNYDRVAITLHWLTALLVFANFGLAMTWDRFGDDAHERMEHLHMSFGVLLSAVIVLRLVWRWIPGHQVPAITAGWVALASKGVHYLLYGLLVAEAVLGFAFRWGAGRPMDFFGLEIQPLIAEMSRPDRRQLRELHEWIGWAIVIIALIHAAAALYHHYVVKDRVLERMLPLARRR